MSMLFEINFLEVFMHVWKDYLYYTREALLDKLMMLLFIKM